MSSEESGFQRTDKFGSNTTDGRPSFDREYDVREGEQEEQPSTVDPDLTLDVPLLGIEELNLDVENLRARISLQADLADMVKLSVGVQADVDKVKLAAKGVEAQLLLKAGLDNVRDILGHALEALQRNPAILTDLFRDAEESSGEPSGDSPALETPPAATGGESDQEPGDGPQGGGGSREAAGVPQATGAARQKAEELGVDLSAVQGTGAGGRILVSDVRKAAK